MVTNGFPQLRVKGGVSKGSSGLGFRRVAGRAEHMNSLWICAEQTARIQPGQSLSLVLPESN